MYVVCDIAVKGLMISYCVLCGQAVGKGSMAPTVTGCVSVTMEAHATWRLAPAYALKVSFFLGGLA